MFKALGVVLLSVGMLLFSGILFIKTAISEMISFLKESDSVVDDDEE